MSRFLVIAAALMALAGPAAAQPAATAAPATHAGTRLSFPQTVGGAVLEQSQNQGNVATYMYGLNKLQIYVSVFDGGRRIPTGSDSPQLMTQFTDEVNQAQMDLKTAGYIQFERPSVPSSCSYGNLTFRCIVYSVNSTGGRLFSKLLMTGYHDYFLKIRIDWAQTYGHSQADADKALQAFVPALVR
ncbi:hypothetical protein SAMN02745126_03048 [Enhydrobacter aerosaccus]|uniref:Uncharacterized protein n=1 Tax=Enhydrobacter aerosaccus TaxID=225324 RepID=A0A1T4PW36_9HYPH|nr:hypothetical protein [Enhydrobacter aerosaccus]SJZ95770.1 hypothetical protein SAMN02745126_03048 [Enhydrobacter aerosaccus]